MNKTHAGSSQNCFVLLLFAFFTFIIYSNTLNASWQLDDHHTIVDNPWIHIYDFYPDTLKKTFYASHDQGEYKKRKIYRPAAMLSFALNWYYGQNNVTGYHVVNILIHIFSGFFLFLAILNLLKTSNVKEKYKNSYYSIALMASAIWIIHPIQTQAVTYIVQRMASMAGLFYIAGLYLYIKARLLKPLIKKTGLFFLSFSGFMFAVASKQNAAMLPFVIIILEFVFFQDIKQKKVRIKALLISGGIIVFLAAAGTFLFLDNNFFSFLEGYSNRSFTLSQRLLTQPRIIVYYLYQIFFPFADNLSIGHEIIVSKSLFSPWTTLPSIVFIICIIGTGFYNITKRPVLAFSIFFFFINHVIESTIIPLELMFEHRNYIPSMFLFVPVAQGCYAFVEKYRNIPGEKHSFVISIILISCILFTIALGTYTRNFKWQTPRKLWEDAIEKAPGNARPYQNLAIFYYFRTKQFDKAVELLEKSIDLKDSKPGFSKMVAYNNLSLNYSAKKQFEKAVKYSKKAVDIFPYKNSFQNHISALINNDKLDRAQIQADKFIKYYPENMTALKLKTIIMLKKNRYRMAEKSALKLVKAEPFNITYLLYYGIVQMSLKNYKKADYLLNRASKIRSQYQISSYLCLAENQINAGNLKKARHYIKKLVNNFNISDIRKNIKQIREDRHSIFPVSTDLAASEIAFCLENTAGKLRANYKIFKSD